MEVYVGVIATFIAICTTFVVCYQIISTWNFNKRIRIIRKKQDSLDKQLKYQSNLTFENRHLINGDYILHNSEDTLKKGYTAFLEYHRSLKYSIELNHSDYSWLFETLNHCIDLMTRDGLCNRIEIGKNQKDEITKNKEKFISLVNNEEELLKKNRKFKKIRTEYNLMRKNLNSRLDDL